MKAEQQQVPIVQPDNGHLVDAAKKKLQSLHIKNFNFLIINLLTEYVNLLEKIGNLRDNLSDNDKQFFFWQAIKTMPEQRFLLFTENEHNKY